MRVRVALAVSGLALAGLAWAQESGGERAVQRVAAVQSTELVTDDPEHRWALLIGVDEYKSEAIRDLRYAGNDVRAVADQLEKSGSWLPDHIVVMTSDATRPDLLPTRSNIYDKVLWLRNLTGAQSVLFYYSGHGVGHADRDGTTNYILPSDVKVDARLGPVEALKEDDVVHMLDGAYARQRLVVLDACRNQPTNDDTRDLVLPMAPPALTLAEGTQILRATRFGEVSLESEEYKMGVFTHQLVQGLAGTADGASGATPDGLVTVGELFEYVRMEMQVAGQRGNSQVPELDGPHTGDFVVVRWPKPLDVTTVTTRPPQTDVRPGVVRVTGDVRRVKLGQQEVSPPAEVTLPPATYTIWAEFAGFHLGPAGEVELAPGEEVTLRCNPAFVSCDVARGPR